VICVQALNAVFYFFKGSQIKSLNKIYCSGVKKRHLEANQAVVLKQKAPSWVDSTSIAIKNEQPTSRS
jgi:hypothetical protein